MSNRRPTSPRRVLALLAVMCVALAATGSAIAAPGNTTDTGTLTDTVDDTTDDATDTVDDTTDDATDTVDDTTDDATDTVDDTTDDATDTVDDTTDDATDTTDSATGTVDDGTVENTTESVNSTVNAAESDVDDTVNTTTGAVSDTVDGTTETLDATVEDPIDPSGIDLTAADPASLDVDPVLVRLSADADPTPTPGGSSPDDATGDAAPGSPSTGDGGDVPTRPLRTDAAAMGGALAGGLAVRRAASFAATTGWPETGDAGRIRRTARRATRGWLDGLWRVAGLFGYQRYDDSDPLEHESRAAIHRLIESRDGAYLSEISRETAIPLSTARYHLRVLDHEGLVRPVKMRGKRLYFPAGSEPSALRAALTDDGAAAVLGTLAAHGPDSTTGLADAMDRDVSTVSHHLGGLADDGLVVRERDGPAVVNRLAPGVRDILTADGRDVRLDASRRGAA